MVHEHEAKAKEREEPWKLDSSCRRIQGGDVKKSFIGRLLTTKPVRIRQVVLRNFRRKQAVQEMRLKARLSLTIDRSPKWALEVR